jgi:hypothetical protein
MTAFDKAWGVVKGGPIHNDAFTCECGNNSSSDGFATTVGGKEVEPDADGPWAGEYTCERCGKIYDQNKSYEHNQAADDEAMRRYKAHKKRRLGGGVMEGRLGVPEEDPGTTDKLGHGVDGVEEVRDLVQQGMEVMPAVREIARLLGLKGSELMRAYVEAYR